MDNYSKLIREKTRIQPQNVVEIGSRDGNDAHFLAWFFNIENKNVHVVEPNPAQYAWIIEKYPLYHTYNVAIYDQGGKHAFHQVIEDNEIYAGMSSLLWKESYRQLNTQTIETECLTGLDLLDATGEIDLCKIDVEGATWQVLRSFGDKLGRIRSMHIECEHTPVWENQYLYADIAEYLRVQGFVQIYFQYAWWDTVQSDSIWVRRDLLCDRPQASPD